MPHRAFLIFCLLSLPLGWANLAFAQESSPVAEVVRGLSADVLSDELSDRFKDQTWRLLRARGDAANQRDVATSREGALPAPCRRASKWENLENLPESTAGEC